MSKKKILLILLVIIFGGYAGWQLLMPNEPIVNLYKWKYEEMSKPEYLQSLRDFCDNNLHDSIKNLNYSQLITWEHKYLTYTSYEFKREDMPIAILKSYITDKIAFGRCGEFALCYNGLCLANGYKTRLIIDDSKATGNKTAGDHVWVEVWADNRWIHIDPTEQRIDQPKMYAVDWNKEINNVVAITKDDSGKMITIDVTKDYQ
jgi:hypothetical protein